MKFQISFFWLENWNLRASLWISRTFYTYYIFSECINLQNIKLFKIYSQNNINFLQPCSVPTCVVHSEFENWLYFPISQSIPSWKVDYNEIFSLQGPTIFISLAFGMEMSVLPPFYGYKYLTKVCSSQTSNSLCPCQCVRNKKQLAHVRK